jgi:hypothetical protein
MVVRIKRLLLSLGSVAAFLMDAGAGRPRS